MAADNPNLETGEVNLFSPETSACPQPVYRRMLGGCPVARAAITGGAPFTIDLRNLSENSDAFEWNFGDGSASSDRTPSHTYTKAGPRRA